MIKASDLNQGISSLLFEAKISGSFLTRLVTIIVQQQGTIELVLLIVIPTIRTQR